MSTDYRGGRSKVTLLERCRELRLNSADAERLVWRLLRNRQLAGAKLCRQHQFGPYILDFYCAEHRLAVEVDGGQHCHDDQVDKDAIRMRYLEGRGVHVLRFTNSEVVQRTEAVIEQIWQALENPSP